MIEKLKEKTNTINLESPLLMEDMEEAISLFCAESASEQGDGGL